jgi:hypothetical protein
MMAPRITVLTGAWLHHYLAQLAEQVATWAPRPGLGDPFGAWTLAGHHGRVVTDDHLSVSAAHSSDPDPSSGPRGSPQTHHHVGIHEQ